MAAPDCLLARMRTLAPKFSPLAKIAHPSPKNNNHRTNTMAATKETPHSAYTPQVPHEADKPMPTVKSECLRGFTTGLPIMLGCLPLGFILGVEAGRKSMTPLSIWLMTSANFAGGSEFAAVALWSAAPPMLVVWLTTWLINSRHIVMGASLSLYTRQFSGRTNALIYFLMCDEVWAIANADIKRRAQAGLPTGALLSIPFYFSLGFTFWSIWAVSAAAGAWLGADLGDISHLGVQMAFPATFLSLLAMMWPGMRKCHPIVISAVVAALASFVLPTHWCVLLATLAGLTWVWFTTPEKAEPSDEEKAETVSLECEFERRRTAMTTEMKEKTESKEVE